ncbi:MAG: hypothetical protein ACRDRM_00420 [Pseudonocardiaceae bacterium]
MVEHDLQRGIIAARQAEHPVRIEEVGCGDRSIAGHSGAAPIAHGDHSAVGQIAAGTANGGRRGRVFAGIVAASAIAGLLYTVASPTVAFTYLAAWMLIALAMLAWVATSGTAEHTP